MAILQTHKVKKIYGEGDTAVFALNGVNISIEEGEVVAIVGTSGSGKTTLLNMIGGLDTPTEGEVVVRDFNLSKMKDEALTVFRRRNVGFVFQNYNLLPLLNAYENIILPLQLDGKSVDSELIEEL
ncbi:MAG: ATP-binding cassette domain-containing protein, partial [Clostridiales Family XIII bacterium]|nr:ATP-binding cassette domain-containing protein [Clostridiales Family XIII bacterium]